MEYRPIEHEKWSRYDLFRHFYDEVPCAISMCDDIDVTKLNRFCRESGNSFYISMLYAVASVVNSHDEFKMKAVDSPSYPFAMPAVYDKVNISHNIFKESSESYIPVFTVYTEDYECFLHNCRDDIERARRADVKYVPCGENVFEASCVPWRHFNSVGLESEMYSLLPIVCWGKLEEKCGTVSLPLSIQINHASADGFHIARFLNEVESFCATFFERIK